ncbi:MAG: hypothetical protein KFF73_14690, partial [Cyclobacteriaceae bacterium]|nr:hypothetical protein [Cyclobacteriaceae bacterium]
MMVFSCNERSLQEIEPSGFTSPPDSVRIYAWWHWMVNAISREGITRDLEAMKEQGIAGATILNVGDIMEEKDYGVPQVIFGSDEWFGMFHWALQEAERLGITIGAHNCDGWSTSGGPWITPETSMKSIIWSKSILQGSKPVDTLLLKPSGRMDYYEDVAVIAYRITGTPNSFQQENPHISLNDMEVRSLYDGSPVSGIEIQKNENVLIEFSSPFPAGKLLIHPRVVFSWSEVENIGCDFSLSASDDGKNFRPVVSFRTTGVNKNQEVSIPHTEARFYSLKFENSSESSIEITELELLGSNENPLYNPAIAHHMDKIVSSKPIGGSSMFETSGGEGIRILDRNEIMDVTDHLSAEGRFTWEPPDGTWEVIRFGYTTTGAMNLPPTEAGRGLECDKMDTAALNLHFNSFPAKLIETAGSLTENTFRYLFIDSWECGYQNWTKNFPSEFERRRGYSILPWIPVLSGEIIENNQVTEAFLHDFRLTIGELIEAYYYQHFARLCKANGLEFHAEVIYGGENYPPLKVLRSNQYVDLPMFEFWTNPDANGMVRNNPVENTGYVTSAEAGQLYGKKIIPAEAYTGYAYYSEAPWDLKPFGDRAFCRGINRMVLHSYVHQPTEKKPGMTLGWFANHFNRHNTWWPHLEGWTTFQARVQYLLQQGIPVSDILYLEGDRMPQYQP